VVFSGIEQNTNHFSAALGLISDEAQDNFTSEKDLSLINPRHIIMFKNLDDGRLQKINFSSGDYVSCHINPVKKIVVFENIMTESRTETAMPEWSRVF
jgi:hypothetical protein